MTSNSTRTARDLENEAARSDLSPADRAKALSAAAARIRTIVSADPVETLSNELVASALRSVMGPPTKHRDFLTQVSEAIDIAATEMAERLSNDEQETRKASLQLLAGNECDLSGISNEGAQTFIDGMLDQFGRIETAATRVAAVNALLRSIDDLPRNTTLGGDEVFAVLVQQLCKLVPTNDMDPTTHKRAFDIMSHLISAG